MDRYIINECKIELVKKITITLINRPTTDEEFKQYTVYTGDLISLLYTENMADVGKNDTVYRGRVIDIVYRPEYNIRQLTPNWDTREFLPLLDYILDYNQNKNNFSKCLVGQDIDWGNIFIRMDISTKYNHEIKNFKLSNVLDINDVDYEYQPDNPELIECKCKLVIEEDIKDHPLNCTEKISETL